MYETTSVKVRETYVNMSVHAATIHRKSIIMNNDDYCEIDELFGVLWTKEERRKHRRTVVITMCVYVIIIALIIGIALAYMKL